MLKTNWSFKFFRKMLLILILLFSSLVSLNADDAFAPNKKPTQRPRPQNLGSSLKKPWTDYVAETVSIQRDRHGTVKVQVLTKNLGDIDGGTLQVGAVLFGPTGVNEVKVWTRASLSWLTFNQKVPMDERVSIGIKIDPLDLIKEVNEENNRVSWQLLPSRTYSSCTYGSCMR